MPWNGRNDAAGYIYQGGDRRWYTAAEKRAKGDNWISYAEARAAGAGGAGGHGLPWTRMARMVAEYRAARKLESDRKTHNDEEVRVNRERQAARTERQPDPGNAQSRHEAATAAAAAAGAAAPDPPAYSAGLGRKHGFKMAGRGMKLMPVMPKLMSGGAIWKSDVNGDSTIAELKGLRNRTSGKPKRRVRRGKGQHGGFVMPEQNKTSMLGRIVAW